MIVEKSHLAGAVSPLGQHCARCHAVLASAAKAFVAGARVAVIVAPVSEACAAYQVFQVTKETPRMCLT